MGFNCSILVVEDVLRSRQLYEGIFHLKVSGDFGIYNVGFEGGLSLYRKALFEEISGTRVDLEKHHNVAVYFEIDDLESMEKTIAAHGFEFIHPIREQPWKQRNFRFYDYDNHVLEVAETMDTVFQRMCDEGTPIEEMARVTGYPVDQVMLEIEKLKTKS